MDLKNKNKYNNKNFHYIIVKLKVTKSYVSLFRIFDTRKYRYAYTFTKKERKEKDD